MSSTLKPRAASNLLAALLCLTGCTTFHHERLDAPDAAAERYCRNRDLAAMVEELALPVIERGETPGLVVGVLMPDGSRQSFGFGTMHAGSQLRPDGDTVFGIGSLTKGMVAAVAESLSQRGVISWDETLHHALPAGTRLSPDAAKITLRQLASHTSGLPRQPFELDTLRLFIGYLFSGRDFYRHLDHDAAYAFLTDWKAPSGEHAPRYSNIGFGLLAHVLELRTGKSIETLMDEELIGPLQLQHTGFHPQDLPLPQAIPHAGDQPYFVVRGRVVADWDMNDFMRGTGGLYSSANDLLVWLDAHQHGPPPLRAALTATLCADAPRIAWHPAGVEDMVFQFGVLSGFSAYAAFDPQRGSGVVVLQNSLNWDDQIGLNLLRRLALTASYCPATPTPNACQLVN